MKKVKLTPRAIVRYMLNGADLSIADASRQMGRERRFLGDYTTKGRIPTVAMLAEIAAVCGYEVHIVGHGEDITVEVDE